MADASEANIIRKSVRSTKLLRGFWDSTTHTKSTVGTLGECHGAVARQSKKRECSPPGLPANRSGTEARSTCPERRPNRLSVPGLATEGGGRPTSRIGTVLTRSPCGTLGQDAAPPSTLPSEKKVEVSGTGRPIQLPRRRSLMARVIMAF